LEKIPKTILGQEGTLGAQLEREIQVRGAVIFYFNDIICNCVIYWCM